MKLTTLTKLTELSDAQLLESLKTVCGQGRAVLARLLAHLVEVEERRLHLEAACHRNEILTTIPVQTILREALAVLT